MNDAPRFFRSVLPSRRRTRHLGALDEWGQGILEALDDGSGTSRGSYEVTAKHVTVATWTAAGRDGWNGCYRFFAIIVLLLVLVLSSLQEY